MNIIEVKNKIIDQEGAVFNFFKSSKQKNHFPYYFHITRNFKQGKIDDEFKRIYAYYYVMNRAGLRRPDHFDEYFRLLKSKEINLTILLKKFYKIPRQSNSHALLFSFATKLMHTVDNTFPIYDENIRIILALPKIKYGNLSLDQKINQRLEIYEELKDDFIKLLSDKEVLGALNSFRVKFKQFSVENSEFEWEDELINDVKLLDSILWASHQLD